MTVPFSFIRQVRHALVHLYDPEALRQHDLIGFLGLSARANAQTALRETLISAIESLRPTDSVPVGSRAWRVYQVLQYRYVQQMDQEQTAHQLGVGVRHLRREQRLAVETLAEALFEAHHTENKGLGRGSTDTASNEALTARLEEELSWLRAPLEVETAAIARVVPAALDLLAPLAATRNVCLERLPLPDLPPTAIHPNGLRQAIVSVVSCAIRRAQGGLVSISAERQGEQAWLKVVASVRGCLSALTEGESASLQAARALLSMYEGRLETSERTDALSFSLIIPLAGTVSVLLIDDNADVAQLFERYVFGSRYCVHATRSAEQLFELVSRKPPQIIILDVMIPGVDGWEILGRLRQHPLTSALPIIVCTVLPERDLALALGATAFLPKPVSREMLLAALNQAWDEIGREPR